MCHNDSPDKRLILLQSFTLSLFGCWVLVTDSVLAALEVCREGADNHLHVSDYQSCTHLVL